MEVKEKPDECKDINLSRLNNHVVKAEEALRDHRFIDCLEEFSIATVDMLFYMEAEDIKEIDERNCPAVVRGYINFKYLLCDLLAGRKSLDMDDVDKAIIHNRKNAKDVSNLVRGIRVVGATEFKKMRLRRMDCKE